MKIIVSISLLLVAFSIAYHFFIFLPKKESDRKMENAIEVCSERKQELGDNLLNAFNKCNNEECRTNIQKNRQELIPENYMEKCVENVMTRGY